MLLPAVKPLTGFGFPSAGQFVGYVLISALILPSLGQGQRFSFVTAFQPVSPYKVPETPILLRMVGPLTPVSTLVGYFMAPPIGLTFVISWAPTVDSSDPEL